MLASGIERTEEAVEADIVGDATVFPAGLTTLPFVVVAMVLSTRCLRGRRSCDEAWIDGSKILRVMGFNF